MTEREKVIKGLEESYQAYLVVEGRGVLVDSDENEYALIAPVLMRDALALLKAQEPRVMTFSEVKKHYNLPPVFPDDLEMQEDYYQDIQPLYFEFPNPCEWDVHWRNSDKVRTYLDEWEDRYNKTWRCWTSRPTDEQREATPWN